MVCIMTMGGHGIVEMLLVLSWVCGRGVLGAATHTLLNQWTRVSHWNASLEMNPLTFLLSPHLSQQGLLLWSLLSDPHVYICIYLRLMLAWHV